MVPPLPVIKGNYKANGFAIGFLSDSDQVDMLWEGDVTGCSGVAR
jgi:hypothetical protein